MERINASMKPTEWLLLVFLSVLWGGSFFFNRVAVSELPPFSIVTLRVGLGAAALQLLARAGRRRSPANRIPRRHYLVMGVLNNVVPFSLIVWGQTRIAGGLASVLNATTPLITIVFAHFFTTDEKITTNKIVGLVVGLAGILVITGPGALSGAGAHLLAQAAVLGAACCYAAAGVYGRVFRALGSAPLDTAAGQVTASAVVLVPITLIVDKPWQLQVPSVGVAGAVIGLALLSTALAYLIYFRILATAGASNLLLVTFLIPITAIVLGTIAFAERLTSYQLIGTATVFIGLLVTDGRVAQLIKRRRGAGDPDSR